ncbi:MAG: PHP domain-containing protein, partial [Gaiellaceae bacterium]
MTPDRTHPFTGEGEWLRCALHAHTTRSDGELEPDALAAHYERAGYDVLAITDHWKRTEAPSTERLLVLPSVELNCILPDARDGHVLGYGIRADADLPADLIELGAEDADLERTAAF